MGVEYTNGLVKLADGDMYYAAFGSGSKKVVVLPGLSDGLTTVKGMARLLAPPYKRFLADHRVYMFSRRNELKEGVTIADMADDQAAAMKELGIESACVLGVSQGGMVAQSLAADHPDMVSRLVLTVTAPCANDVAREAVEGWIRMAEAGDHKTLMIDTAEKSYSEAYKRKHRKFFPMLGLVVPKPKDYGRFLANAKAILAFDARGTDVNIKCPTLIIGGSEDRTVGSEAAGELHEYITGSELYIYEGLSHAVYEEAPDFYTRVFEFFDRQR